MVNNPNKLGIINLVNGSADFLCLTKPQSRLEGLDRFSVDDRNVAFYLEEK